MNEGDYALLIGINDYTPPQNAGLRKLRGAINDTNMMEKWLLDKEGGDMPQENIKKILSSEQPLLPLQDQIDDAFLEIEAAIKNKNGSARRFYFYFAGHGLGTLDSIKDIALCLANWSEMRRHSAISSENYKEDISKYGYFEEILFFADCCRNTKINIKPKSPTFSPLMPSDKAKKTKIFIAYATQYQDESYEIETKNQDESEMRGAFTTALLNALNGGAAENGKISVGMLEDYLWIETPKIALEHGYKQIPEINSNIHSAHTLFSCKEKTVKVNFIFSNKMNFFYTLLDGKLRQVHEFDTQNETTFSLNLTKGMYIVKNPSTGDAKFLDIQPKNEEVDVRI
ncbi:caspase family protein [Belliella marina]|uniref:Caspase family protein n=1 Tax=Belliella marina TaxID=1644146 RepID=A0ABW4VI28_9BACT